jgi:hypothetical protein
VIVSDEPPYKETGPGTDFTVVLSTELQGALKIRPADEGHPVAAMSRPSQQEVHGYRMKIGTSDIRSVAFQIEARRTE